MKKVLSFVMVIIILLGITSTTVYAENIFKIMINGKELNISKEMGYPFINEDSRTMVPFRVLLEGMGYTVEWNAKTRTITIPTENGGKVVLQIDSNKVQTSKETITMDTKAVIINGRTYVPIRFVADALEWTVGYQQLKDNSGNSTSKVTHKVTVDKITSDSNVSMEENGIMVNGVRKYDFNMDLRNNEYLLSLEKLYGEGYFYAFQWGAEYSRFGNLSINAGGSPTLRLSGDPYKEGYWTVEVKSFNEGKERPAMLSMLKVISSDADVIYNEFVEMWDDPDALVTVKKRYNFGQWKTVGKTTYMFDTTSSNIALLKIKY